MSKNKSYKTVLTIRQQNLNRSETANWSMINTVNPKETDIIAIQEPYLDFLKRTRATRAWTTVLPTRHYRDQAKRSRALLLVNSNLTEWEQIPVESPDVVAVKVRTKEWELLIVNLYSDISHSDAIYTATDMTKKETQRGKNTVEILWVGDFNRHHPMWDKPRNTHLFTRDNLDKAQDLINCLDELEIQMVLPAEIPTLKAFATGNLTRPDNVFASEGVASTIIECNTVAEETPPKVDHFPIVTKISTNTLRNEERIIPNFKMVDWDNFRSILLPKIRHIPIDDNISDYKGLDTRLENLTGALKDTIAIAVPKSKITAFTKRWWTKELTEMNRNLRRIKNRSRKRRQD